MFAAWICWRSEMFDLLLFLSGMPAASCGFPVFLASEYLGVSVRRGLDMLASMIRLKTFLRMPPTCLGGWGVRRCFFWWIWMSCAAANMFLVVWGCGGVCDVCDECGVFF